MGTAQHVLAPLDVVRRVDGHDVIVSDVAESLTTMCGRRDSARSGWSRGEVVTIAVSLLRGIVELEDARVGADATGEWWLTTERRPIFVLSEQGEAARASARVIISRTIDACDDRVLARHADTITEALERPQLLSRRLDDIEGSLFEAAAPQPLAEHAPARDVTAPRQIDLEEEPAASHFVRDLLERHVDGRIADLYAETVAMIVRAVPGRSAKRPRKQATTNPSDQKPAKRAPLIVAAVAGAAVLAGGLLWPTGPSSARASPEIAAPRDVVAEPAASSVTGAAAAVDEDALGGAERLLLSWDACPTTCETLFVDDTPIPRSGAVARPAQERSIALIDDYGGVAVLEVSSSDNARTLFVIEKQGRGWKIRDAYE